MRLSPFLGAGSHVTCTRGHVLCFAAWLTGWMLATEHTFERWWGRLTLLFFFSSFPPSCSGTTSTKTACTASKFVYGQRNTRFRHTHTQRLGIAITSMSFASLGLGGMAAMEKYNTFLVPFLFRGFQTSFSRSSPRMIMGGCFHTHKHTRTGRSIINTPSTLPVAVCDAETSFSGLLCFLGAVFVDAFRCVVNCSLSRQRSDLSTFRDTDWLVRTLKLII